jgi:Na+/H+ antiporter NhaD/arsenite permease-like protein
VDAGLLVLFFRRDLHGHARRGAPPPRVRVHRPLLVKALSVAAGMFIALLAGAPSAIVAAAGAATLLLTRRVKPERVYRQIDWDLLVLFVGLFVLMEGARQAGLTDDLFTALRPLGIGTVHGLTIVAAVLSNLISNVPAVMLFTHVVPALPDPRRGWLTLAMASTLAGNLTIVGSIANLIVVESARRHGIRISFWEYLKVGVPITIATLAVGIWWLT